jgi:hypothetical protein
MYGYNGLNSLSGFSNGRFNFKKYQLKNYTDDHLNKSSSPIVQGFLQDDDDSGHGRIVLPGANKELYPQLVKGKYVVAYVIQFMAL